MESWYATYVSIIVTYLISCTVSEILWIIDPIFTLDRVMPLFNALVGGKTLNLCWEAFVICSQNTIPDDHRSTTCET